MYAIKTEKLTKKYTQEAGKVWCFSKKRAIVK